jgi:peptide/nickel transport system substrate-binding protein
MQEKSKARTAWKVGAGFASAAVVLAACGSSTGSKGPTTVGGKTGGGTAYFAEGVNAKPNWIFPFASLSYFSVTNLTQFQELMYRPLYYFGSNTDPAPDENPAFSLASVPVWSNSNKTMTISLKGWKFRDGQVIDAQSFFLWMNMMESEGAANWAGYVSGTTAFPGNITGYSAPSATSLTVTVNLTQAFSTTWYLYNELSQITPMPEAWDVTSPTAMSGSGDCGATWSTSGLPSKTVLADCAKVWSFDTDAGGTSTHPAMAGDVNTYGTNPLWADGADGPWYLSGFNGASGEATFSPNAEYSGAQHPKLAQFVELPYTSDGAEYNALAADDAQAPNVGYLPGEQLPQKPAGGNPLAAGANAPALANNYNLDVAPTWSINYFPENFDSTYGAGGNAGKVFSQLYFRQALQELISQQGIITTYDKGYGVPTYGPAPVYPKNDFTGGAENLPNGPYPYNPTAAKALLVDHGWSIKPQGTSTCIKPGSAAGECGAGIPAGTPLSFHEVYVSGSQQLEDIVNYEVSQWETVGINVATTSTTFSLVLGVAVPCIPKVTAKCQHWDMANWGGGWLYSPDYLPTGEEIFATGAGSNSGNYNDPKNNSMIIQTNVNSSLSIFIAWESYLADQLPVIWQPDGVATNEVSKNLQGVTPFNALANLNPEFWYFSS